MINIEFENGEYVCGKGQLNYQAVLDDFYNAKQVRVMTFNISKNNYKNELIDALKSLSEEVDVQIITNIPSRMQYYTNSSAGQGFKDRYKKTFTAYLDRLNPEHFESNPTVGFNFTNHAKIIGTDNILYVGSANYSDESAQNVESGILIRDKESIKKIYEETFPLYMDESVPYFDDEFNALRLFVISMEGKFTKWLRKIEEDMIFVVSETDSRYMKDNISFDLEDLSELYFDINELRRFTILLEDTYSEIDKQYNEFVQNVLEIFNDVSLEWMENLTEIDSPLYELLSFDEDAFITQYLADDPDAYDETLDDSINNAINSARDKLLDLRFAVEKDVLDMYEEIVKIVKILNDTHTNSLQYSDKWIANKVDNT